MQVQSHLITTAKLPNDAHVRCTSDNGHCPHDVETLNSPLSQTFTGTGKSGIEKILKQKKVVSVF